MGIPIIEHQKFDNIVFSSTSLVKGEYEKCTFTHCDFNNLNLSQIDFLDCVFDNCNLSSSQLSNTGFKTVTFKNCKLLGLLFTDCNPFLLSLYFEQCLLNLSSFYKLKLKGITFNQCSLQEVDFTACDLSSAVFNDCDLKDATFDKTILLKADLRTAYNYSIDPEKNAVKKAKFSLTGISGLLHKYDIRIE